MSSESLMDHFESPRNVGEVESPDATARAMNPVCGDEVTATFRIRDGVVVEMRYRAFGCHATVAAMSCLSERVAGRTLEWAAGLGADAVAGWFEDFPVGKRHAAEVAVAVLGAAAGGGG